VADISAAALLRKVMAQVYLPKQACRHAKISRQQLTKWQEAGLIARADSYEYRDIVTLRALERMKRAGLKGRRLREAVAWLHKHLPERDELLDQLRVTRRGRRTFVRVPGQELELWSGQLQLSFDTGQAVMLGAKENAAGERRKRAEAEQWFQRGLELEQQGASFDQVVEAYRTACEMDDKSAGAFVNLGTIYFNARMWRESERYYNLALEADPSYPLAHFNLANLCDERGDKQRAFHHYEEAVRLKPVYADAHYNLALLYQSAGQTMKALKHWRTYLRLDPASAWAEIARRELKKLQDSALVEGRSTAS
jgi:tetratricopeptide (TPR) repeat protein